MQYMSYMVQYYYSVLVANKFNQPNFTDLFRIVESVLYKNEEANKKFIERLEKLNKKISYYAYNDAGEKELIELDLTVAEMELIFYKNADKGLATEIEIRGETFRLGYLFFIMNEVIKELTSMISKIAYDYDIDMPMVKSKKGIEW